MNGCEHDSENQDVAVLQCSSPPTSIVGITCSSAGRTARRARRRRRLAAVGLSFVELTGCHARRVACCIDAHIGVKASRLKPPGVPPPPSSRQRTPRPPGPSFTFQSSRCMPPVTSQIGLHHPCVASQCWSERTKRSEAETIAIWRVLGCANARLERSIGQGSQPRTEAQASLGVRESKAQLAASRDGS